MAIPGSTVYLKFKLCIWVEYDERMMPMPIALY